MAEDYFIPISRKSLLSVIDGPPFKLFNIATPTDYCLAVPGLATMGGMDSLQMQSCEAMFSYLSKRFEQFESKFFPMAEHDFEGFENSVAETIVEFSSRWIGTGAAH